MKIIDFILTNPYLDRHCPWLICKLLDRADYSSPFWRARFYRQLETDFEPYSLPTINHQGKTLRQVILEGMHWKSGDLKNGRQSITISEWEIAEGDMRILLTPDWAGLKVYKKGSPKFIIG